MFTDYVFPSLSFVRAVFSDSQLDFFATALCRDRSGDRGRRKDVRADDDGLTKH